MVETDHMNKENGNLPEETSAKGLEGQEDDANGNSLASPDDDFGEDSSRNDASLSLDKQYDRVKVQQRAQLSNSK